jgi:hypothetical protein
MAPQQQLWVFPPHEGRQRLCDGEWLVQTWEREREKKAEEIGYWLSGVAKVTVSAAGDGVEPDLVWLAVLVNVVGDDADGLALFVWGLACVRCVCPSAYKALLMLM